MRRNIARDTLLLTVIQMALDGIGLLLNVVLTNTLGTSSMGILTLTTSFYGLASVTASGNAFLCTSRFLSEELGKPGASPRTILRYALTVSLLLSVIVSLCIILLSPLCSLYFLKSPALTIPIQLLAASLPLLTVTACIRGCFNAYCKTGLCAAADTIGFLVRCLLTYCIIRLSPPEGSDGLCTMTILCTCMGSVSTLFFLLWNFKQCGCQKQGRVSITWKTYLRLAVPVMFGSILTAFLSAANDALVPLTLKQSGSTSEQALSQFGIFEAIILPALFFPSTVLCSLSGILVTEMARETAADNRRRIIYLTEKTLRQTILFAVFVAGIFLLFGKEIGTLLGGGAFAGKMLVLLAPVIPFIYLEIVLESILKGIGAQGFSSVNYFAEYFIRISFVLIFVPLMGFYGIVLSYYASNLCGNISRLIMAVRKTGLHFDIRSLLFVPVFSVLCATQGGILLFRLIHIEPGSGILPMGSCIVFCGICCLIIQKRVFQKI